MSGAASWRWQAAVYALAGASYVVAGIWQKALLNWIVGPLWLVAFVAVADAVRTGRERRRRERPPAPPESAGLPT